MLNRRLVVAAAVWVVLFVVLVGVLSVTGVNATVFAGALGAYCGATIVAVMTVRERASQQGKRTEGLPEGRYR